MRSILKTLPTVLLGNLLMQFGIVMFVLPSGLVTGGTTGIALAIRGLLASMGVANAPISLFVAVFNVLMFLLGWWLLGRTFAMTTLVSTVTAPVMLQILQTLIGDYVLTDDLLLCALFGGFCIGASIAMIVKLGASTGGMDIPPLLLKKFFGVPVSVSLYAFDFLILLLQSAFVDKPQLLYGLLMIVVYTLVLDKIMALGDACYQLEIVSEKHEEIRQAILSDVDRGVTLLRGETGYLAKETNVILCVIAPRERHHTEQLIQKIDPQAFMILSQVTRVSGKGFSMSKKRLPPRDETNKRSRG